MQLIRFGGLNFKSTIMNRSLKTLLISLLTLPQLTHAQKGKLELGIESGPNVTFGTGKISNSKSKRHSDYGASLGVMFQWNSQKHFSFRTGLSFEQKSFTSTSSYMDYLLGATSQSHNTYQFGYFTIPFLARFTYGEKVHFFFNTGIFLSALLDQRTSTNGSSSHIVGGVSYATNYSSKSSNLGSYNGIDLGLIGGIGIGIPIKKHWYVSAEIRENFSIPDLEAGKQSPGIRLSTASVLLGISYKLRFWDK